MSERKDWITSDREKIIEIYRLVCSERVPGLPVGFEYTKNNGEMLEAIKSFVEDKLQ